MAELTVSRHINAPADVTFDVLTDARRYPGYTPIRRVEMEREGERAPNGEGAIRALHVVGPTIRERVIVYERPSRFAFEVISGAPGVSAYVGTQTYVAEAHGTRVTYRVEVDPAIPGTGLAVAATIRGAIEVLMKLVDREAQRRVAAGEGE